MGYIGTKPSAVPLTSADITDGIITSAKIADGTIVNADINASAAIDSTKLSGLSSDFVKLATTTITANTTAVTFDGYFSSTYDTYIIYGNNILLDANANFSFLYRVSGSDVTSSYTNMSHTASTDTTHTLQYAVNHAGPQINYNSPQNSGDDHLSFRITIHDPNNNQSVNNKLIQYEVIYYSSVPSLEVINGGQINRNSTSALSGFKIKPSAGNFDSGSIVLYGVKK